MRPGSELLAACRASSPPDYVQPLPPLPLPIPAALHAFEQGLRNDGAPAALSWLFAAQPARVEVEDAWKRLLSGPEPWLDPCDEAAAFLAGLFHHVSSHCEAALCGWDLFHAHLFVDDSTPSRDWGLVFHAKEFPQEFTLSSRAIPPLGDPAAGGPQDPRRLRPKRRDQRRPGP